MGDERRKATASASTVETCVATLEEAKRAVEEAEMRLRGVLSDIERAPRAEKTNISQAIENTLESLKTARVKVVDAEKSLESEQQK